MEEISEEERALFAKTFKVKPATLRDAVVLPDRFLLSAANTLRAEHGKIAQIQGDFANHFRRMEDERVAERLRGFERVVRGDATSALTRGRLLAALVERLLWMSVNSHTLGRFRPEFEAYAFPVIALARRWLSMDCDFPQPELAAALNTVVRTEQQFVLEIMGTLVTALERCVARGPLDPSLRAALDAMARWLDKAVDTIYRYDGRKNALVGGVRVGNLAERLHALADGAATPAPVLPKTAAKPLLDLRHVPVLESKVKLKKAGPIKSKLKPSTLTLQPLDTCGDLARAVFGEKPTAKLRLAEISFEGVRLVESGELPIPTAQKYLARAHSAGTNVALVTHSIADARPKATDVRRALAAQHDDEAFRGWLRAALDRPAAAARALQPELEAVALELVGRRAPKPTVGRSFGARARVVALAGASTALLPALYGLGPYNDCPDAVTHAAVLGRWHRQWGARVRALSRDALSLDIDAPPEDAAGIVWTALAAHAYCPGESTALDVATWVRASRWFFWWD